MIVEDACCFLQELALAREARDDLRGKLLAAEAMLAEQEANIREVTVKAAVVEVLKQELQQQEVTAQEDRDALAASHLTELAQLQVRTTNYMLDYGLEFNALPRDFAWLSNRSGFKLHQCDNVTVA